MNVVSEKARTKMLEFFKQSNDMKTSVGPGCLILEFLQIMSNRDSTILVGKINCIISVCGSYIV